jgi:hypothetical protein
MTLLPVPFSTYAVPPNIIQTSIGEFNLKILKLRSPCTLGPRLGPDSIPVPFLPPCPLSTSFLPPLICLARRFQTSKTRAGDVRSRNPAQIGFEIPIQHGTETRNWHTFQRIPGKIPHFHLGLSLGIRIVRSQIWSYYTRHSPATRNRAAVVLILKD